MPDLPDFGFAAPPFSADGALVQLRRALRDLRLNERGPSFELRGKCIAELKVDGTTIAAKIARKPALTPEWDRQHIKSAADQRQFVDEVRKRLARWERED